MLFKCLYFFLSLQKHDPPTSSIPCLHYKKMKDQEERELNGEVAPNAEELPVKPGEQANGDTGASKLGGAAGEGVSPPGGTDGPDGEGAANSSLLVKEPQPCDSAQGALGQVKAKVEVCKDESIGKDRRGPSWERCRGHTRAKLTRASRRAGRVPLLPGEVLRL